MLHIILTDEKIFKSYLYLKFQGICGIGSEGNDDIDFIIDTSKIKVAEYMTNGLILDFQDMCYEYGNRFLNLFEPNKFGNNKMILISIIINEKQIKSWKTLLEFGGKKIDIWGSENSVFQENLSSAIKSINKRFNVN